MSKLNFLVHDSSGLSLQNGPPSFLPDCPKFPPFEGKVKFFTFSSNGKRLAWIAGGEVVVVECQKWSRIGTLKHPRAQECVFSPQGNYLAIWDIYTKVQGGAASPNLSVYDVSGRKLLKAFFQQSQTDWKPQWTKDESLLARSVSNEVHFYKADDLQNIENKKILPKVKAFSLSPSIATHNAVFFVPSLKSAPAYVHLFRYPNFSDNAPALAQKSFFKVETLEVFWNPQCYAALILTTAGVDHSGSYYGDQMLYYLSTSGDSIRVTFSKPGNIRSLAWCPSGKEFFAVYGAAPARATLFNRKCDAVAEFGEGAHNLVLLNPPGNIVMLGGMGNISSRFEMWDVKEGKLLGQQENPDLTHMEWSPCGKYFLTSTCSPRLRVNNGYKIWHYTAVLQHEVLCAAPRELYASSWIPDPAASKPFAISSSPVKGIQSQVKKASKERYIPPSQRAAAASTGSFVDTSKRFLSQRDDPVIDPKIAAKKMASEKKKEEKAKKSEEKQKQKEAQRGMDKDWRDEETRALLEKERQEKKNKTQKSNRIKNIKKKLKAIEALNVEIESGKAPSAEDLKKLEAKYELVQELQKLQTEQDAEKNGGQPSPDQLSLQVQEQLSVT